MRKQIINIFATVSLFLMLGIAASAQTAKEMTVNIPFDFYVGKTELPAGTYSIYRTSATSGDGFILRSDDLKRAVIFNAKVIRTSDSSSGSRIEFRRLNDRYFLSRILPAGKSAPRELEIARIDRDGSRNKSGTPGSSEIISIPIR